MSKVTGYKCDWCGEPRDPKQLIGSEIKNSEFYHVDTKKAEKHICAQCVSLMYTVVENRLKKRMTNSK